jgi:flagellar hook-associated protein 2
MAGTSSISGLVSGLDTSGIISKLMDLEKQPVINLQNRQADLNKKLVAWQEANTRAFALKDKADILAQESTFDAKSFSSGDESAIKGSASWTATAGTYYVKVNSLARSEQDKTQGYADINATLVGTGTISIKVGSGDAKTVTVGSGSDTLAGLRDAINQAKVGVSATIIDEGTGTNRYHLILTSQTVGTGGALTIDTSGLSGGTAPVFSIMQEANDAVVTLGEGAGAITVTRNTNTINDLITGVTLNLQRADTTKTITVDVKDNTAAIKQNIQGFVEQYNNFADFLDQQFSYDTTTGSSGVLFSDSTLQMIQSDLNGKMFDLSGSMGQTIRTLSQLGITTNKDGMMQVDDAQLTNLLESNRTGVKELFVAHGETTNPNVSYTISGPDTKPTGSSGGYAVEITTVATQSATVAGATQTDVLTQDETLTINGKLVNLTTGMSPDDVVNEINKNSMQTRVTASRVNGALTLTSIPYGSRYTISAASTVASGGSGIGDAGLAFTSGVDVAGTINGEEATGNGQALTGNTGNANTDGLTIKITATSAGSYGTVSVTKGLAAQVSDYFSSIMDSTGGAISTAQGAISTSIDDMKRQITHLQEGFQAKEDQLVAKFAAMESALSKLKGQGDYLTGQFAQASGNWGKK